MRHRQTKGAATDMFDLPPLRHISTLRTSPVAGRPAEGSPDGTDSGRSAWGSGTGLHAPFPSLAEMHGMHLLPKPGDQPEWQFRRHQSQDTPPLIRPSLSRRARRRSSSEPISSRIAKAGGESESTQAGIIRLSPILAFHLRDQPHVDVPS